MKKLFGTDGIRGKADSYPFDDSTMIKIGYAISTILKKGNSVF